MDPQTARQICEVPPSFPLLCLLNFADMIVETIVVFDSLWMKCNSKTIIYSKPNECALVKCISLQVYNHQRVSVVRVSHRILIKYTVNQVFYSTTDAQVNCLKNNIKIYIKTAPTCFGAVTPSSGSALFVLAKVTVVKIVD